MTDRPDDETGALEVWTTKVPIGRAPQVMRDISSRARDAGATVLVLRGELVFGADHLRSALTHAKRAMCEGTNSADSLEMETLLFASGERQLSSAITKMGLTDGTEHIVIAKLSGGEIAIDHQWKRLPDRPTEVDRERLKEFGISEDEMSTVPDERVVDLVLERVAAVDVLKR